MKANYLQPVQRVQVSRKAMGDYLMRASVDKHVDKRIREHEAKRMDELSAFMSTVDANWLYTLHTELGFGQKRLRRAWEAMVRNRIAIREFYRDGSGGYEEQPTGKNVEDEVTVQELLKIGVDIKAWEREGIHLDKETGEVTFGGLPFEQLSMFEEDTHARGAEDRGAEGRQG